MLLTHGNLNISHQLSPALFCLSRNPPISCSSQQLPAYPSAAFPAPPHTRDQPSHSRSAWDTDLSAVHSQSTALKVDEDRSSGKVLLDPGCRDTHRIPQWADFSKFIWIPPKKRSAASFRTTSILNFTSQPLMLHSHGIGFLFICFNIRSPSPLPPHFSWAIKQPNSSEFRVQIWGYKF